MTKDSQRAMPSDTSVDSCSEVKEVTPKKRQPLPTESLFVGTTEYLPYTLGYLPPVIKEMAYRELGETEELKVAAIKKLKKVIEAQKNLLVRDEELFYLAFLRGHKYNVDRAFKCIQNKYRMRAKKPMYDSDDNSIVHEVFRQNFLGFLPYRAKDGSVIAVVKLGVWDPLTVDRDLLMWVVTHLMMHSTEDPATQVAGYTAILDLHGVGNKHLKMLTLENILLIIHGMQNCWPGRYKGVHVIGIPAFFQYAYAFVRPFILSSKLRNRIFIHGENLKALHKHVSPAILPEEYGGELGPFDNSAWHEDILTRNEWCLQQRIYGYQS